MGGRQDGGSPRRSGCRTRTCTANTLARRLLIFGPGMSKRFNCRSAWFGGLVANALLVTALPAAADETFPTLKVGDEVYTNVTITGVTATDIYFSHAQGLGNAKLKNLDPKLQRHFDFDGATAGTVEQQRREANAQFRAELAARKPAASPRQRPTEDQPAQVAGDDEEDMVVPKLYAKSFRGQRPPQIIVEQWLTPPPDVEGKFVLVDFWATWCGPCRQSIPHLNELQAKFKDRLLVIGLSDESPEDIRKMQSPQMGYSVGTDPQARTLKMVEVQGIPHAILIDPKGIVRFEGMPGYLTEEGLARLLAKYAN
jgi:cytochrome c biogenesis protein CcmG, thiol:disulfide interchange protein DsbE